MLAMMALTPDMPVSIDLAGMPPQIQQIRAVAVTEHLAIICEGKAGEERVVRVRFPTRASVVELQRLTDGLSAPASMTTEHYSGDPPAQRCDMDEPRTWADAPSSFLGMGPPAVAASLARLARRCGFRRAHVRAVRREDLTMWRGPVPAGWIAVDAGGDRTRRYGPTICYSKMGYALTSSTPPGER